jgi:hypothetical protein
MKRCPAPKTSHGVQDRSIGPALTCCGARLPSGPGGRMLSFAEQGEQQEQGRSRQSPPQPRRRNQPQARQHPDRHIAQDLRTRFCRRLSRDRETGRDSPSTQRNVTESAPPRSWDRPPGAQDRKRFEVRREWRSLYFRCRPCDGAGAQCKRFATKSGDLGGVSSPLCKNISVPFWRKSPAYPALSRPIEGRLAIVTNAGRDAVDVRCAPDESAILRTAKPCGPDAPTLASSW